MNPEDPFAIPEDSDRTIIRPTPGGRRGSAGSGVSLPITPLSPSTAPLRSYERELLCSGINSLVTASAALLGLVNQLRSSLRHADINGLRTRVAEELRTFETSARAQGISPENILAARYALCTLMDEVVLSTPWGSESSWAKQSLLSTFHNETWGGEKFFDILERVSEDPTRNIDLLELLYLCLGIGFEGKFRVLDRGRSRIEELQDNLYRRIRNVRGDFERDLSPHWQGATDCRGALIRYVPLWVVAAVAGALLLGMYATFNIYLKQSSDPVFEKLQTLGQNNVITLSPATTLP